ncbi:ATP-dependent DNA helicase PIF1-like [Acanthaster planci]|uniref:ATP-dependent DNA helicase PIF1 n=1 Tax=Acanthaster planci TaxID=133434 RepID=A0A8B7Y5I7_ACAPL|nr:ATP-dependent DNA helicase PIF1-like [Acanthaster planci]XP_022087807.1 ATP-dependent DNA helicase PIF1-like [Acanthaster planci]
MNSSELCCTVSTVKMALTGETLKRTNSRNATLVLGRNEFRDIILCLKHPKNSAKYLMRDIIIHKRFVKDGKACIQLPSQNVQIMISNCPPHHLAAFLKCLVIKEESAKEQKPVSERTRLLSELPRKFEEISPLCEKDVNAVNSSRAREAEARGTATTPAGPFKKKSLKRLREKSSASEDGPQRKKLNISLSKIELNQQQSKVLNAVLAGHNVFFTGSAGTGKSFLLKKIIGALPPDSTFATASTGVAACHIGGTTLHQFAGIGSGNHPLLQCIQLASRPARKQLWRKCRHLVVDEISMIDGELFTKLEAIARAVKGNNKPFGGIQLIVCGDFLQLPPVTKPGEKRSFCFQSRAWHRCIQLTMELTEVKRQEDPVFIDILQKIRIGRCSQEVCDHLTVTAKHSIDRNGIIATKLCTHKADVDLLNQIHLRKLLGDPRVYQSLDSDPNLVSVINSQCPVPQKLELRVGAQVMLAKNLDIQRGLVNGARGVVTGFGGGESGLPVVKFMCGIEQMVKMERWPIRAGAGITLSRTQLPLKLAWAISIHKSQGMSLDCVEISLSRVFECGQAYVALSRARSLEGLRVIDFDKACVHAHPDVLKFYHEMRREQRMLQPSTDDYEEKENIRHY